MYTVEQVVKGSQTRVVSAHEKRSEALYALRNVSGIGVVRGATGIVVGTNLARSTGNLRKV